MSARRPRVAHLLCADRPDGYTGPTGLCASHALGAAGLARRADFAEHATLVVGSARDADDAARLGAPRVSPALAPLGRPTLAIKAVERWLDANAPEQVVAWGARARELAAVAGWHASATLEAEPRLGPYEPDPGARAGARRSLGVGPGETVVACLGDHAADAIARTTAYACVIAALASDRPITVLVSTATPGVDRVAEHISTSVVPCGLVLTDGHPAAVLAAADAAVVAPRVRPNPERGEAALRVAAALGVPGVGWKGDVSEPVAGSPLGAEWLTDYPEDPLLGSALTRLLNDPGAPARWLEQSRQLWADEAPVAELAHALGQTV